jgi:hypothetical protein
LPRRYAKVGHCHPKHCFRMTETGESQNAVAARYSVHRSMMSRLWQLYQLSGSTNDGPSSGRPRITNPVEDLYIQEFQPRHRTATASQTPSSIHCLRRISAQTVRMVSVPNDLILVLFWNVNIVEQGWDGIAQSGYGI